MLTPGVDGVAACITLGWFPHINAAPALSLVLKWGKSIDIETLLFFFLIAGTIKLVNVCLGGGGRHDGDSTSCNTSVTLTHLPLCNYKANKKSSGESSQNVFWVQMSKAEGQTMHTLFSIQRQNYALFLTFASFT